jgi:hypothetical protein
MDYTYKISMYDNDIPALWLLQAIVISIVLDSVQKVTNCTQSISQGVDFS